MSAHSDVRTTNAAGSPDNCAYRGCTTLPTMVRATASGVMAHYCYTHGQAAELIFETKQKAAKS